MLTIVQSNKIETLFDELLQRYAKKADTQTVFEPFNVIVPSKVMGEWLKKQVADQTGISTLVTTEFWGRFFIGLMQRVLRSYAYYREDVLAVPDVAMLSRNIMQWQIFGFISANQAQIMADESHPLYPFVYPLVTQEAFVRTSQAEITLDVDDEVLAKSVMTGFDNRSFLANASLTDQAHTRSQDQRLWQLATDMATMLNRYMTYRPLWLEAWGNNQSIDVKQMIDAKDSLHNRMQGRYGDNAVITPEWLVEHYQALEVAQRYLWQTLFDADYRYREALQAQFWQALHDKDERIASVCRDRIPKQLILFTIQQLPPTELLDLQKMGELTEVVLLHFNPSEQFWADIVDKNWLMQQQFNLSSDPAAKQAAILYLKDYGHTLLSRFGKQSREVFAMLANLSGNEYGKVMWQDRFVTNDQPDTLLAQLQQDILMLEESNTAQKVNEMLALEHQQTDSEQRQALQKIQQLGLANNQALQKIVQKLENELNQQNHHNRAWQGQRLLDSSLSIHACHSFVRQLEVLRMMVVGWLNHTDKAASDEQDERKLSDILVLLPDIEAQQSVIEAIFPKGVGADGYTLPAKVTGVVGKEINQLWQAIVGYFQLLNRTGARFGKAEVFDWLLLPPLYESFGLTLEQMNRGCELLEQAGFIRGFDEHHLSQTLHQADDDYRYSFAYALERLVAGVMMPQASQVRFGSYVNRYGEQEQIKPLDNVSMEDAAVVAVLCDIYQTLEQYRNLGKQTATVAEWLSRIEALIQQKFSIFNQTNAWLAIFSAQNELKNTIEANQRQQAALTRHALPQSNPKVNLAPSNLASHTEQLPLKLNFVLESIAEQLVSQQVSAEPSGVITFARMGAVRNLPYKLVVMLNLNLTDFPQREPINRYSLIQAGLPVRGDRFREDDDLGAFLDALLCAKQACWLFYNGNSNTDTHEHLPASPVQELLSFLQTEVQWQSEDEPQNSLSKKYSSVQTLTFNQKVEQYLVTHHPALPFDKDYFQLVYDNGNDNDPTYEQQQIIRKAKAALYPPAPIWHNLYTELSHDKQAALSEKVKIWQKPRLKKWLLHWQTARKSLDTVHAASQQYENLSRIIRALQDPAKAFLQFQNIYVPNSQSQQAELEPVVLDGLTRYQLNALLLNNLLVEQSLHKPANPPHQPPATQVYSEILPAGVNRYQSLSHHQHQFVKHLTQLADNLVKLATDEQPVESEQNLVELKRFIREHFAQSTAQPMIAQPDIVARFAQLLTACNEQRIAINLLAIDENGDIAMDKTAKTKDPTTERQNKPVSEQVKRLIITAQLPTDENSRFWFNYLATSGREKYTVQFWLNHLAWQVARRTTLEQAAAQDGFSLWQFSDKKTLYLPAIDHKTAYHWLQDWLMVWQLSQHTVIMTPPKTTTTYIVARKQAEQPQDIQGQAKPSPSKFIKDWFVSPYNQEPTEDSIYYPLWQLLLADKKPSVILPFLDTVGTLLYEPLIAHQVDLFAQSTSEAQTKSDNAISDNAMQADPTAPKPKAKSKTKTQTNSKIPSDKK